MAIKTKRTTRMRIDRALGDSRRSLVLVAGVMGLFLVGLVLGLFAASLSPSSGKVTGSEATTPSESMALPWQELQNPEAEVARIANVVGAEDVTDAQKHQELSLLVERGDASPLLRGLASFAAGVNRLRSDEVEKARQWLSSADIDATALTSYASYLVGVKLESVQPESARELFHLLTEESPDFVPIDDVRLRYGRLLAQKGMWEEAARQFQTVLEDANPESRADALYESGGALAELGRKEEAVTLLEELYYDLPEHRLSADAGSRLRSLGEHRPKRSPDQLYRIAFERAERLYGAGRYREAYNDYTQLLSRYKSQADNELILLRQGVCQYERRQNRSAETNLGRITRTELKPEAVYYRAEAARRLGKRKTYEDRLDLVLELDPRSRWAEEALWSRVRFSIIDDEMENALLYAARLTREFPDGRYFVQARWLLLWDQYRSGRYASAAEGLELTAREHPESDELSRFLYWGARAYENAGRLDRAEDLYRQVLLGFKNTYYGRRAGEHLTALVGERAASDVLESGRKGLEIETGFRVLRKDVLKRIEQLVAVGLFEEAEVEAERAAGGYVDDPAFLAIEAWIYSRQGRFRDAISAARRAFPFHTSAAGDLLPRDVWELLYPLKYWGFIERYSQDHQVDPYLVASLIRQESTFDRRARSRAGARGLMQIMPHTGRKLAAQHGRRYRAQDLYDPEINIRYGTHYLQEVLDRFGGRLDYALASYNAGPHRVRAWTGRNLTLDPEEFIEEIPFTETRDYVKLVLRNEMLYRRFYNRTMTGID